MPFARTLPSSLPRRFAGARHAVARTTAGSFELILAERFALRLRGLARLEADQMPPLLFPRCRSLHTYWMAAPIAVAWLDLTLEGERGHAQLLRLDESVGSRRTLRAPGALGREAKRRVAALELPSVQGLLDPSSPTLELTLVGDSRRPGR
ncbi:MAG: hypothetical protein GEU88_19515 [Solirubrobacterales bacterium]|nr:hypothetical protein [Solirubrobacterales bacterium]